jgi:hypothetical protein
MSDAPGNANPLDILCDAFALPASARIERRVAKSLLSERGALSSADRRRVDAGLERLTWRATLKPAHAGVPAFSDAVRDYALVVVMSAQLRPDAQADRLGEVIHRAIAHPLVLLAGDEAGAVLSIGLKRRHEREADRVVVERLAVSPVVTGGGDPIEATFLSSLKLAALSAHDLWSLHMGWGERAEAFAAARITGAFRLADDEVQADARRAALAAHAVQACEVARLRKAAAGEQRLNRRIDLSRDVTQAAAELARLTQLLA